MPPRREVSDEEEAKETSDGTCLGPDGGATIVVNTPGQPAYVHCTSLSPFVNPTVRQPDKSPAEKNQELNLNLGQTLISPQNKTLLWIARFLSNFLVQWWEHHFFKFWGSLPLKWKQKFTFTAWKLYLPLHKMILGRRTGIHRDVSPEYHALTTVMWWGRFFPATIQRMRFMLSELTSCTPAPLTLRIEKLDETCELECSPPVTQVENCRVKGYWVHATSQPTEYTLLWIYGGAFLAGDARGNLGPASYFAKKTGMDVFLATHRLVPEYQLSDMVWDICLAYRWLIQRRRGRNNVDPSKVLILGISSGGGLAIRLLQSIAETSRGEATLPDYLSLALQDVPSPKGAITLGPFCDYTTSQDTLSHYSKHDLIVTPGVLEEGLPYLETNVDGCRKRHSPVYRSFEGCPPLCVVLSEHEAVYDHAILLINNARAAGVPVTVGMWKYMCHVFTFLNNFIPEGQQSVDFACKWLLDQQK